VIRTSGPTADSGGWGEGSREAWPVRREGSREASTPRSAPPQKAALAAPEGAGEVEDGSEELQASPKVKVKEEASLPQKGGAGNEALFDALLMVARGTPFLCIHQKIEVNWIRRGGDNEEGGGG